MNWQDEQRENVRLSLQSESVRLFAHWRDSTMLNVSGWLVREDGERIRAADFLAQANAAFDEDRDA